VHYILTVPLAGAVPGMDFCLFSPQIGFGFGGDAEGRGGAF
jgi:hypothetical protein